MNRRSYAVGDQILLKAGLSRATTGERACRIVSILPADHGEVQYRVRLDGETFERRIVQSDIETEEKASSAPRKPAAKDVARNLSPWLKPLTIRTAK